MAEARSITFDELFLRRHNPFSTKVGLIALLGGDKTAGTTHTLIADKLYDEYLRELEREGLT